MELVQPHVLEGGGGVTLMSLGAATPAEQST